MDKEILLVLEQLLDEVKLLTSKVKANSLRKFSSDFLSGGSRRDMYELFNDENNAQNIADELKCSRQAVQKFIQELQAKDLIETRRDGHSIIPIKSISKIATYYSKLELEKKEENENG